MTSLISFTIITLMLLTSSCSTYKKEQNIYERLKEKAYANDPITVATAVDLAGAAYLKGCVDARIELGEKRQSFFKCRKASVKHVQEHIIDILEQPVDKGQ